MADVAKSTATAFVFEGYSGDEQAFTSVFINPETDPLNEAGRKALENHRTKVDPNATELEVRLYLPYPVGGIEQYLAPEFLKAYKAAYTKWAAAKGVGVEFNLDKWILGQERIDVNRDRLTPWAYEMFTVAGVKNTPKKAKAAKSVKADKDIVAL